MGELKQATPMTNDEHYEDARKSYDDERADHEHVTSEVERVSLMLKRLEESVGALAKRLDPLILGDVMRTLRESTPEPVRCALASRIAAIGDHAYELVCRVDELRASVDL